MRADWLNKAVCKGTGGNIFCTYDLDEVDRVIATYCDKCSVSDECREFMWDTPLIAGGTTRYDRLLIEHEEER